MDAQWLAFSRDIVRDIWDKYGPFAALLILVVGGYNYYIHKLWTARIRDKNQEIERLVTERNRIQDIVIPGRLSSEDNH